TCRWPEPIFPTSSPKFGRIIFTTVTLRGAAEAAQEPTRFMVPMHAQKRLEALHEPTHPRPLPGGEQAFVRVPSVPLLGGVRGGFMVPMHAQKRMEAFHEPPGEGSGPTTCRPGPLTRCRGFMVPVHDEASSCCMPG